MIPSGSGLISSPISSFSASNRNETLLLNVLWFMSIQMICRVLILTDISSYLRIIYPLIIEVICRLISDVNNRCSPSHLFSVILNHEYYPNLTSNTFLFLCVLENEHFPLRWQDSLLCVVYAEIQEHALITTHTVVGVSLHKATSVCFMAAVAGCPKGHVDTDYTRCSFSSTRTAKSMA